MIKSRTNERMFMCRYAMEPITREKDKKKPIRNMTNIT